MKKNLTTKMQVVLCLCVFIISYWSITTLFEELPLYIKYSKIFNTYDDETFSVLKGSQWLGAKSETEDLNRKEIGPLPKGKFISAYIKEGTYTYEVPDYYYSWGTRWARYKQDSVKYVTNLSVYDISDEISLFESEYTTYVRLMKEFRSKIKAYENWEFNPIWNYKKNFKRYYEGRINALSYCTTSQDGTKTIRSIYFANKKVYVLEVQADREIKAIANRFLNSITTLDIKRLNNIILLKTILLPILIVILAIIFVVMSVSSTKKMPVKNQQANSLFKWASCMMILNVIIMLFIIVRSFFNSDLQFVYYGGNYIDLEPVGYITMATIVVMDLLICPYLYNKRKEEFRLDYLIPSKLHSYLESRTVDMKEKKTLLSFICYPLVAIGAMPMGILCLVYIVPFVIILFVSLEIRHLYKWIYSEESSTLPDSLLFLDYYVILDLKENADKSDIENAFNSAMSKYNSANGNPLYGRQYYNNIQEAYAILSSSNKLRPAYDKEYDNYKSGNAINYIYIDKHLENEIKKIRTMLYKSKNNKRELNINIVLFSFFILLITTYVVLMLTNVLPPLWENETSREYIE